MNLGHTIEIRLDWDRQADGVELHTVAGISVVIDDRPIWPVPGEAAGELEWYVDELLAHLAECWKPLMLRQTYPIPVQPTRPSLLRAKAEERWSEMPGEAAAREEERLAAFEDVHNLAGAFGGVYGLPSLWVLREGNRMVVDAESGGYWAVPFEAARGALVRVGNEIADHLETADREKWAQLASAWRNRDEGDRTQLLVWTTGLERAAVDELVREEALPVPTSTAEAISDSDELPIAARLTGALPLDQIKTVLAQIRDCRFHAAPSLDVAVDAAMAYFDEQELAFSWPYEQGVEMARWLRDHLQVAPSVCVDPFDVLQRLGVDVSSVSIAPNTLEAIAVWGQHHGPAVLLNRSSWRLVENDAGPIGHRTPPNDAELPSIGAARVTAAHEVCHLLLDREHTTAAVDVLGNRMPPWIEQRARAFAGEFLLPGQVAADRWRQEGEPTVKAGVERVLREILCVRYGVTMAVAAWKLQQGLDLHSHDPLVGILNELAPYR